MPNVLPEDPETWRTFAKREGVEKVSIREISNVPSASRMEEKPYLCLRIYWTEVKDRMFDIGELGVTHEEHELAKDHLKDSHDFEGYIDHMKRGKNSRVPLRLFPTNLGIFALVRHFQLQIPGFDKEDSSVKHIISPRGTRSRTNIAAESLRQEQPFNSPEIVLPVTPIRQIHPLDLTRSRDAISTPSIRSRRSSGGNYQPFQQSSPSGRCDDRLGNDDSLSFKSSDHSLSDAMDGISFHSAISEGAAKVLYPPSPDEMIVNTSLILLLNAIAAFCQHPTGEWNLIRKIFRGSLGDANLEARTDGYMQTIDDKTTAIVEVKACARSFRGASIWMQESTQIVTAIASKGFPAPGSHRFILLSQDRHEVYLSCPHYDMDYIKYLKGEQADLSLLEMRSYGPWDIYASRDLRHLCGVLLALTISASRMPTP